MGTRTFWMRMPFGRVHSLIVLPTGSGNAATSRTPFSHLGNAFVRERQPVEHRRGKSGFAARREVFRVGGLDASGGTSQCQSAIARSNAFFASASSFASARAASRDCSASYRICCFRVHLQNHQIIAVHHHTVALDRCATSPSRAQIQPGLCRGCSRHRRPRSCLPMRRTPLASKLLPFVAERLFRAIIHNDRARRSLEKRDPALATGQFVRSAAGKPCRYLRRSESAPIHWTGRRWQ